MNKQQFIYRKGTSVTITRIDNSTYQTYMLYRQISRSEGTFSPNFVFGVNYLRGGVFRPSDDIKNGYIVTVNQTGEQMFVAAWIEEILNGQAQSTRADMIVLNFPTQVTLKPSQASQNVARDKFGRPTASLPTSTINIVVSKAELDITPVVAGGKPKECIEFYTRVNTVNENDEIVWNGHTFRTTTTYPFGIAGQTQLTLCKAEREVDA